MNTETLSPHDTGEIRRPDLDLGETRVLNAYAAGLPPTRRPEALPIDRTEEIRIPRTIGIVAPFQEPGQPRPPAPLPTPPPPRPRVDQGAAQPIAPLERVAGVDETAVRILLTPKPSYVGRHRATEGGERSAPVATAEPVAHRAPSRRWPVLVRLFGRSGR